MADWVTIPSALIDRLAAIGVDVSALLRLAGLVPSRFRASRARLTTAEFFAFWRAMEGAGGTRARILRLGTDALPHQLDVASLAALHSPTFAEALQRFARYKRLVCAEAVDLTRSKGEARIRFHWLYAEPHAPLPLLLVDVTFATILSLARAGLGASLTPRRIALARRRSDEPLLARHFGCPIVFDAPLDLIVFDEAALERPFATHNADLMALLVPGLEAALDASPTTRSVADDVKAALQRRMCGERPSVDKVAEEVRLSPRTLQRRLGELGTSYQALLDDVRRDTARRLLGSTDLDAGEVAFLLGFEELNSFTRAFAGWEGVTPSRWRDATRA
ncbi:MAG TPA: AraC family transcriptional regulator ligand-binding domain-containing protein [Polyangia bacterium]|nr:AraC family transcriptional regulator ligand-binding domain-containing protein [Polyangia bacterium]